MRCCLLPRLFGRALSLLAVSAFLFFAMAALPGALTVCSAAAKAQTAVADPLVPGKGEWVVVGKVLAVMTAEKRLALSVTQVISTDGTIIDLRPPVSKTIVLSSTTVYRLMADASQKVTLSDIKPNATLRAVGLTKGAGSPLTARVITIEADANADQQALWDTMPPTQKDSWWLFRTKEPAEAHGFIEEKAFKVTVAAPGAMPSSVQVIQGGLTMENGQRWHLHFRAKARPARRVKLSAIVGSGDFHSIGLREEISLETEWHDYDYTFTVSKASDEGKNQFPSLSIGDKIGTVWITGMKVEEAKADTKSGPEEKVSEGVKSAPQ